MVDNETIKDFKFVTHVYSPDANGKMLLGMAFVLSKQYSDKLSQDVTRGVRSRAEKVKHQPLSMLISIREVSISQIMKTDAETLT